jgi:hypothetical protein
VATAQGTKREVAVIPVAAAQAQGEAGPAERLAAVGDPERDGEPL